MKFEARAKRAQARCNRGGRRTRPKKRTNRNKKRINRQRRQRRRINRQRKRINRQRKNKGQKKILRGAPLEKDTNDVVGDFVINGYENNKNDWHFVKVTVLDKEAGTFQWTNKAGVKWTLTKTDSPDKL